MRKKIAIILTALIFLAFFLSGCSSSGEKPVTLTVSAAASLSEAMEEIKEAYESESPGTEIILNLASSGVLKHQIEQGAPADIFISASAKYMDELQGKGLIVKETRQDLLENEVALIAPKQSNLTGFEDLTRPEVSKIAIAAPESAPAGRYAREVLLCLGIWDEIQPKMVFAKDVRQVLAYVESGNVEVGMVYKTDAAISDKVKIISIAPSDSHTPVTYPMAVLKETGKQKEAEEFQKFLTGEKAKAIFERYGFIHTGS